MRPEPQGEPSAPGVYFAHLAKLFFFFFLAKLLMSEMATSLTCLPIAQACHLGPASSLLKEPEQFLEYHLLQFR
jgi:hypothetical protein